MKHNPVGRPRWTNKSSNAAPKPKAKSQSRCAAVRNVEKITPRKLRTGGLFASKNMKSKKKYSNEILHLAKMLNSENTAYKIKCAEDMKRAKMSIGLYAHDCSCRLRQHFEKVFCYRCMLDGFHAKRHVCNTPKVTKKGSNSKAAEQLWSKLNMFRFATHLCRPHFRCFWRHYAIWRNAHIRNVALKRDSCPAISNRAALKSSYFCCCSRLFVDSPVVR